MSSNNINVISKSSSFEFNKKKYRKTLGMFSTGITVVTSIDKEHNPIGMTVNSFSSVSLDPPLVLWSIDKKQPSYNSFLKSTGYAVNILSKNQLDLCTHFSTPVEDKFNSIDWKFSENGFPIISNSLAWFDCKSWNNYAGGDHQILVGEVTSFNSSENDALIYWNGKIS